MKTAAPEFIELTATLSEEAKGRILSRTHGKLFNRFGKFKLNVDEAVAIQLTIEDENRKEWLEKVHELRAKEEKRQKKKTD
jgi:hypothetical protein